MATLVLRSCLKQSLSIMDFPEPEMKNREQVMTNRVPETRVLDFGTAQCGPENLKKPMPKKLVKSNKSISRKNFFDQIPFLAISKMTKNLFLNWEKV